MARVVRNVPFYNLLDLNLDVLRFIYLSFKLESDEDFETLPFLIDPAELKEKICGSIEKAFGLELPMNDLGRGEVVRDYMVEKSRDFSYRFSQSLKLLEDTCKDVHVCFFFWYRIRCEIEGFNGYSSFSLGGVFSHKERVEQLKYIFVYLSCLRLSGKFEVNDFFEMARCDWLNSRRESVSIGFLNDEDDEQCNWVWEYISAAINAESVLGGFFSPNPSNGKEAYIFSVGILDSITPKLHVDTKRKIIAKCGKAWAQKKYRDGKKKKNKVPINIYVSEEAKQILDEMARSRSVSKEVVVEMLIMNAREN
ncbi:hypothetical protein [Oceanimonas smirnovii]|uniref:hypothetical protein n=1 Tax=Oceanimonas smirnovii TaxID=264574 RepID=UPI00036E0F1B|nr:hypothetical protein [Oceanimonas smirnovii]